MVLLSILLFFTILGFSVGINKLSEYTNYTKNAVTVMATVEKAHLQYREEIDWTFGAGDDIEEVVKQIPYYTYSISYTFEGKEYHRGYNGTSHDGELIEGGKIEIVIDASDPEHIITEGQNGKGDIFFACIFLSIFIIVLAIWIRRRIRANK